MVKRAGGSPLLSIRVDHKAAQPVSTQLCMALREMILNGGFSAGDRLPATRTLAHDLGLSRTTIVEVFSRLQAEGLIDSRIGSGAFVSAAVGTNRARPFKASKIDQAPESPQLSNIMTQAVVRMKERQRLLHEPRAFTTALPAFDLFPMAQWARLSAKFLRAGRNDVMGYSDPFGLPQLRRAVASHLRANRGVACDPEQIFIVGGAQQAFHLIGSMLLNPGDKVWFENPGAIGASNSFIASGAELVPVPVDGDGLRVDEGLRLSPNFRLVFVTPSHQQPLGNIMSLERRLALLAAAGNAGAWVVEDDYDGEFFFGSRPPPTLKSADTAGLVIYVGTFSKSLFPALRLGYVLAPPGLVETFRTVMSRFVQGVPTHTQAVVASFIDEGLFAAHVRRMRPIYQERHAALLDAAARRLGGLLNVIPAHSGLHTVGYLGPGLNELQVSLDAKQQGISVAPIGRFAIKPVELNGLVLGFGIVSPPAIDVGVEVLARLLQASLRAR